MSDFTWPADETEATSLARELFINASVEQYRYWLERASDLVTCPHPKTPFERQWSDVAKQDRMFREIFQTFTEQQRAAVLRLLDDSIRGAVFSTLCTLDQFPQGEVEITVVDGLRRFQITPAEMELHDDFMDAALAQPAPDQPST